MAYGLLIAAIGLLAAEEIYLQHLRAIEGIASSLCRRHGIRGADAEDFASEVRLRLLQDDYAVIRKHRGDSSMTTFLTVVIANLLRDFRIKMWGKWRPSAEAKRLGEMAILLETAMYRDSLSFEDACAFLERDVRGDVDRAQLRQIATKLPVRAPRRIEGEEVLAEVAAVSESDGRVLEAERLEKHAALQEAMTRWLATLASEDQLIIKLRFYEGLSVADTARALGVPQKPLYSRIARLLQTLSGALEREGIGPESLTFFESP
jgi:RNA polymerase sigma factor for flagellar operon FliA